MAARVVLLDLDGTVWDSYPWYSRVLERTGLTQAGEIETALWKGRSLIRLGKDLGVPRSRLIRMIKGTSDAIPLYPGVVASLARLSDRGTKLGIVTSLSGAIAVPMLARAGIDGLFQTIVHPGVCRTYKPNARPILVALEALGEAVSCAVVYVGDREDDAAAARNAGIRFGWAAFGYGDRTPSIGETALATFGEIVQL